MRRNRTVPRGQVHRLTHVSKALEGNLLGDPTERELHVYTPYGYKEGARLPLLVDVVGFTGSGLGHTNWKAFTENVPERLDRLIGEGKMGPVVVACRIAIRASAATSISTPRPSAATRII
jgi:hypothetical protein